MAGSPLARRPVILIVEDSPDSAEMYGEYLTLMGFSPLYATTALEGLEIARSSHPDAVVTDVRLSGLMDGLELTRRLRHEPATRDIRIIVLTGYAFGAERDAANLAGCDLFLTKPCLPDALVDEVRRLLPATSPGAHA
jgi:two-component system cell cycle response regulator DivK